MVDKFITYARKTVLVLLVISSLLLAHVVSFYWHTASSQADCAVVFGAAVWPGYYGPVASDALADRTLSAASLYDRGLVDCIILSGADSIYGAHEVDIMTDLLIERDVEVEDLVLDRDGVNTLSTIQHLGTDRSYILVSNDFHLARIGLLAKRANLDEHGFTLHAAEYSSGGRYAKEPYFVAREGVALVYYFFTTLIDL